MQEICERIKERLMDLGELSDKELVSEIGYNIFNDFEGKFLNYRDKEALLNKLFNSIRKWGPLSELMEDPDVSEIMVNGKNEIFVERFGKIEKTTVEFDTQEQLEEMLFLMTGKSNRTISEASPIVDIRLLDGSRANIVLRPIAIEGPVATIRKFRNKWFTMDELIEAGSVDMVTAKYLRESVENRKNIMISGGTGSGKTTFLNVLSAFIGETERVITIEDSAELKLQGIENIVRLEARNANSLGIGRLGIREMIRTSLRMRPDRIIIGEVRGEEAIDMLQAMNTGHDGSLCTGHSNSARDILSRLETMAISSGEIPLEAVRRQIASALNIIVHVSRDVSGKRKIAEVLSINGYENGEYVIEKFEAKKYEVEKYEITS